MTEIVLFFFEVEETASGNVVLLGEYMEGFDIWVVHMVSAPLSPLSPIIMGGLNLKIFFLDLWGDKPLWRGVKIIWGE